MKRAFIAIIAIIIIVSGLSSCGVINFGSNKLIVYNWEDFIDEDLVAKFEDETGIDVTYITFSSNEEMYYNLSKGETEYDVIVPSEYMIEKLINEDLLEPLVYDEIPNFSYIADEVKGYSFDKNNTYSVPYSWGTFGILYNTKMVDEEVDSFDILWDEKYRGQIFMYDSQRDSVGVALKKLGYSMNSTNDLELNLAKHLLTEQKPLVKEYLFDIIKTKMIDEEAALATVYSGDAYDAISKNENLSYVIPKEGSNIWIDSFVVPKSARNKSNAYKFINFMTDPENSLDNTLYLGYSTPNKETFNMLSDDVKNNPAYWVKKEELANLEMYKDLGAYDQVYAQIWNEVLSSR